MPRLRRLSGAELVQLFRVRRALSARQSHQAAPNATGRHAQTLTVPAHATVKVGTLHAIFTQAIQFIPEAELREHFYTETLASVRCVGA
jgi:hypothetical protein